MVGMVSSHLGFQRVVGPKAADLGDMLLYATVDYSQVVAGAFGDMRPGRALEEADRQVASLASPSFLVRCLL
jgi:hypothetical protein